MAKTGARVVGEQLTSRRTVMGARLNRENRWMEGSEVAYKKCSKEENKYLVNMMGNHLNKWTVEGK
jgi:hypothetical protein